MEDLLIFNAMYKSRKKSTSFHCYDHDADHSMHYQFQKHLRRWHHNIVKVAIKMTEAARKDIALRMARINA